MSRVFDSIDISRDILSGTLEIYQSSVSNRLNDIMRILTIFTVILGIFSFITGFFGMNVISFPRFPLIPASIWSIIVTVIITGGMLYWFRRKGWL
jgi:magnesium transporter